ncbi:MAG: DNA mismatch repair protein MutS [Spirochaetes bacterium]|nr:DNA mismatch repair protein MutS [Spirochaetota bacterium]
MINNRRKKIKEKLLGTFGKFKDASFDFEQIEKYFKNKDNSNTFQVLPDRTCKDLDFQELFMYIDRTNSKVGQQYLYNKLRTIPLGPHEINEHEQIIDDLLKNDNFRADIQSQLIKLNKDEAFYITSLFQDKHLKPPGWFFVVRLLSLAGLFSLIMLFFNLQMLFVLLAVFIINIGIHYWNKRNLSQYLGSIPQLLRLNNIVRELFKNDSLKKINPGLTESISVIDKVRNRMSFFRLEANLQGDMAALFWGALELVKILFLLEPLLLFGVLKRLDTKRKEIEDIFVFAGEIDSLISIASLRKGLYKYCIPVVNTEPKTIAAEDMYHPLINDCVANSIHIDKKSILLTGSNMSGKTSFIKTIGINVITGLTLNTCFAGHFAMPKMRVFSAIRISDDLMNDKSYYFEEVLTIKEMIDKSVDGKPNLFLLDEIFKGTNTVERISAGKAVLSSLARLDNIVFVSTHDIELADLLKKEYELYHFSEKVDNKGIDFDYKLKNGKLKNRNAIRILEINGYPENIIKEAIEISKELDKITVTNTQYKKKR